MKARKKVAVPRNRETCARKRTPKTVDIKALMYELGAQQCEIEALNEEICFAHKREEDSLLRANSLYDLAPVGYVNLDSEGLITDMNFAMTGMFGYERIFQIGKPFSLFVTSDGKPAFHRYLQTMIKDETRHASFILKVKRGMTLPVHISGRRSGTNESEYILAVTDISKLIGLQHDLSEARDAAEHKAAELDAVFDAITDGVFVFGRRGEVIRANKEVVRVIGFDPVGVDREKIIKRLSLRSPDGMPIAFDEMPSSRALRGEVVRQERFIFTDAKGRDIITQAAAAPLREGGIIKGAVSVWHDITEREHLLEEVRKSKAELDSRVQERTAEIERSRAELRRLAEHLQTAREEERTSLARELHDELGQTLTVIKFDLYRAFKKISERDAALAETMKADLKLIDDTISKTRNIWTELRPTMLDNIGFEAAVSWLCREFQKKTGIQCTASVEERPLEPAKGLALYRIVQEALTNVARHAGASKVGISCYAKNGCLTLRVADNGTGMNKKAVSKVISHGLLGMRERVLALNGTLDIASKKGKGTTVSVKLPLDKQETCL